MNSVLTVISGEQQLDLSDAPALCDPMVADGLIESWRISASVQGVALILKPNTTEEQVAELKALIRAQGLRTINDD